MENISFEQFKKLDLRVGEIKTAEDIAGADKLYKLRVDIGDDEERRLVAGLKGHYTKEDLIGKKVVVLVNLEPKTIREEVSHGMVLAGVEEGPRKVVLLTLDKKCKVGSKIS
jgi:methionyl-tRNA synthetase